MMFHIYTVTRSGRGHEMMGGAPLICDVSFEALLAEKALDANWLFKDLGALGAKAVIPAKANRKVQNDHDKEVYKVRHLVEIAFQRLGNSKA